ncbi:M23 family metallopeptidase [Actinomycetospora straminea]|uniref:M23ase beta-sheet core domain-containing protein n=1 Tax=Actinomycetospora straminea TaxID=663607 RepID=A0ABP9F499_9PSEU|nr:M23 family metallopeptidase [Actinomycetospora straminea]MDD7931734.1 M23 family metallopeptidase [Actinomycetospora straminea]
MTCSRARGLAVLLLLVVALAGTPARAAPAPPPVVPAGAFGWPLAGVAGDGAPATAGAPGAVTRLFDPPPHYYGRGHRGADVAGHPGHAVVAAGDGTVVFAGRLAGRGVVSVEHAAGLRTTYEPVTVAVVPGAAVRRGDTLGALEPGHRGCPVAACLHWGLRRPSADPAAGALEYLDPLLLLGLGRVRLLPTDP